MRGFVPALIAGAGILAQVAAQQPRPVFRASTERVQIDAVVTDFKGRYVRNLKAVDFEIYQDGRPQKAGA